MITYNAGEADVAVVGAGHAGIEAALACARLGLNTVLFTINLDAVGNMPCNPSIGGTGKGHLVYEIDALGGEMGYAADRATIQTRTLNLGKGPAVHSKRVQADRQAYRTLMKHTIEQTPNLTMVQAEITDFSCTVDETGKKRIDTVTTKYGAVWHVGAAIICAGTFLCAQVIVGEVSFPSGPDGMLPADKLTGALEREGIRVMRFKTGTPARILKSSINYEGLEVQSGEEETEPFSTRTDREQYHALAQTDCHVIYTNEATHEIIRANLDRSPIYAGRIHGVGPRYCPSIEDKVVRFADKERHQLFVEPMGHSTDEIYLQGFSSSLPADVQVKMLHSLKGFEHAQIMRYAYAIEYDCVNPLELRGTLEFKKIHGLYGAGQFNGTSGYEEAAAQGLLAGMNATLFLRDMEQIILPRHSSYIGTLIDDLVTKGTNEPYRIMTGRSEYRILIRQDNAEERLSQYGHYAGLLSDERYNETLARTQAVQDEVERLRHVNLGPNSGINRLLEEKGSTPISSGTTLCDIIRRPGLDYDCTAEFDPARPDLPRKLRERVWTEIKYEGYIKHQLEEVARQQKSETTRLPDDVDYMTIKGLRTEAAQKLNQVKPATVGQAARISGVNPADVSVLLIWMQMKR